MILQSAFDRVVRTLAVSVGVGAVVFTLLGVPDIISQHSLLNPVYSVVAFIVFCGLPPLIAVLAFRVSTTAIRNLAYVHAATALVFLVFWIPAMTVPVMPDQELPWLINTITVATCMAAISMHWVPAWIYVILTGALSGVVRYITYGGGDATIAVQDSVMVVLVSGFMAALLQLTLRAGVEQDAAALAAQQSAAEHASAETLERQRTRYHAFIHDDVLATLLAATKDGARLSPVTVRSAAHTLERMDQFRDDQSDVSALSLSELDEHLRGAATALRVPYSSGLTAAGVKPLDVPLDVSDAISEALTEAMRNSLRHGEWPDGRLVHRSARAIRTAAGIRIDVQDDGRGFNPRRIGLDRLGVRLSILQRVNSQPGGQATIVSSRGNGTVVTLVWTVAKSED